MENWENVTPMTYSMAPIENRMVAVRRGFEAYFSDAEAAEVIPVLQAEFHAVNIHPNTPHEGFTRLSAWHRIEA